MTIEIQGLKLPELLEKLISEGIWPTDFMTGVEIEIPQELLNSVGINERKLVYLCGLDEFLQASKSVWQEGMIAEDIAPYAETHAYLSSKLSGEEITDSTKLDVDKAILIAFADDDDVVFLDYSFDPNKPQVVVLNWPKRTWHSIGDFESFVKKIGLLD
jgi:hypothetical protein